MYMYLSKEELDMMQMKIDCYMRKPIARIMVF